MNLHLSSNLMVSDVVTKTFLRWTVIKLLSLSISIKDRFISTMYVWFLHSSWWQNLISNLKCNWEYCWLLNIPMWLQGGWEWQWRSGRHRRDDGKVIQFFLMKTDCFLYLTGLSLYPEIVSPWIERSLFPSFTRKVDWSYSQEKLTTHRSDLQFNSKTAKNNFQFCKVLQH